MLIGRGKGGKDPETLFKYAVQTNEIKTWRIVEKTSSKIPEDEYGFFFSAECKFGPKFLYLAIFNYQ